HEQSWRLSATGKLRRAIWHKTMVYTPRGGACAKIDTSEFLLGTVLNTGHQESNTRTGWTVGGGIEYAVGYGWSIKGEYLYVDFDHYTTFNSPPFGVNNIAPRDVRLNDHIIRGGLNYKFGGWGELSVKNEFALRKAPGFRPGLLLCGPSASAVGAERSPQRLSLGPQQPSALPLPAALLLGFALVVQLLAAGKRQLELGAALLVEIELERHERHSLALAPPHELVDLAAVKEELAHALGCMVEAAALQIFRDIGVDQPDLAATRIGVGLRDRRLAAAQRFNLRAGEREAGLEGLADLVVEARLAIVGDHANLAVRFRGHPASCVAAAMPAALGQTACRRAPSDSGRKPRCQSTASGNRNPAAGAAPCSRTMSWGTGQAMRSLSWGARPKADCACPCGAIQFHPQRILDAARSSLLALQQVADLREQNLLLGQCGRLRRLGLHDLIHQLDHEEQHPSDDDEVDDDGEETPPR